MKMHQMECVAPGRTMCPYIKVHLTSVSLNGRQSVVNHHLAFKRRIILFRKTLHLATVKPFNYSTIWMSFVT
jgi:hypothetical protein